MGGEEHPDGHRVVDNAHLVMTGDGNGNDDGDNDGDGVVGDADQVGGEGQVHRLGVGGNVKVKEQQAKEEQVDVEVEALQMKNNHQTRLLANKTHPGCKAKEGYGDEKYVGEEAKLDENL